MAIVWIASSTPIESVASVPSAPVFIGDTVYTIRTNLERRPKYNEMGLVRVSYEVFKNKGELALYCEHLQTVKYRNPEAFAQLVEKR